MTTDQKARWELLKEHYSSRGVPMSDLLNRLSSIRAEDPSWPDSSVGKAVEKLYAIVEDTK